MKTSVVRSEPIRDREFAAAYIDTSARRVDELRKAGILRAVRDGRRWKFRVSDLDEYIASLPTSA
ncbi:helix-turn-helix domain-containing protein [Mycobacteroides abscessus]|uniref:helix-turn-helix domain-containing protein n=1 Tax=Mycobacteroides TaxID=670516 RepID=UPI0003A4577F|nr:MULTISPECIES: helix-turn-helix domain-containing protein [Mycobacteroides]MBE5456050.1 hypothetical protein [Mycobacteroides abscessus]MBN7460709.1 helix-turn-helix domain-containing protein [Mycobacteroides abscessus subsp. abscessus]MBN7557671.1 helix-turn-helix domain-containing protein [Mycobacteroides abscessus subsp. abscessus]MDM2407489.1 helix-turn-helix domain-containing protein [Mycobacteroides abscessus]MDM2414954.1 helix-turn-helix domain-containing protein [Mycobacteroides absc